MYKDAKIYRFDYLSDDNHLHHKYYTCLNKVTALEQFRAGCNHKHICASKIKLYKCEQGCHKWELVELSE